MTQRSIFDGTKVVHETLLEKFKGVAREKYELDYPQSDNNSAAFFVFRLMLFVFEESSTDKKLSIENLMDEIKAVVNEKYDVE